MFPSARVPSAGIEAHRPRAFLATHAGSDAWSLPNQWGHSPRDCGVSFALAAEEICYLYHPLGVREGSRRDLIAFGVNEMTCSRGSLVRSTPVGRPAD